MTPYEKHKQAHPDYLEKLSKQRKEKIANDADYLKKLVAYKDAYKKKCLVKYGKTFNPNKSREYYAKKKLQDPEFLARCNKREKSKYISKITGKHLPENWIRVSKDPRKQMCKSAHKRAIKQQVPFDLLYTDVIIPETCPYMEIPLVRGTKKDHRASPSLDKIIPSKGYTADNVQIISNLANTMKSDASIEELITFAKNVLRIHANIDVDNLS